MSSQMVIPQADSPQLASEAATLLPPKNPNDWPTLETETLVLLAQQGNRRALEWLVKRNQKGVYITLAQLLPQRQADIADLTQEVLLRMCRSVGTLRSPKTFKVWLNRIVTNLFYDELRKQARRPVPFSLDEPVGDEAGSPAQRDLPDETARPDHLLLQSELDEAIYKAITQLEEPFRTVVVLREVQGLSYEEIAELTQGQLGTVKSRLARARQRLQAQLQPYLQLS